MWACTSDQCSQVYGSWLSRCPRDGSPLREFGSVDADYDSPVASRFPLRKAAARRNLGRAGASVGGASGGGIGNPARPSNRAPVAEWRSFAIGAGIPMHQLEGASKRQIQALLDAGATVGPEGVAV